MGCIESTPVVDNYPHHYQKHPHPLPPPPPHLRPVNFHHNHLSNHRHNHRAHHLHAIHPNRPVGLHHNHLTGHHHHNYFNGHLAGQNLCMW